MKKWQVEILAFVICMITQDDVILLYITLPTSIAKIRAH